MSNDTSNADRESDSSSEDYLRPEDIEQFLKILEEKFGFSFEQLVFAAQLFDSIAQQRLTGRAYQVALEHAFHRLGVWLR
jgi:hypothetical protein